MAANHQKSMQCIYRQASIYSIIFLLLISFKHKKANYDYIMQNTINANYGCKSSNNLLFSDANYTRTNDLKNILKNKHGTAV